MYNVSVYLPIKSQNGGKMRKFIKVLVCAVSLMCLVGAANAVNLSWTPPTNNVDGTSITNLAGYKLYTGYASGVYSTTTDVGNVTNTVVNNSSISGIVYFAVGAYDTSTNEGPLSTELIFYDFVPTNATLGSYSYNVKTGQATVNFTPPTKNMDGTVCTGQLSGYIIGYGKTSKAYTNFATVGAVNKYTITVPVNSGTWYSAIAATNIYGNIGPYSAEVSFGTSAPDKPGKPKSDIIDLR
jgi:hypothetical protein